MKQRKIYYVTPDGDNGWKVKAEGVKMASSKHDNKADAITDAKKLAKAHELGQVKIQKKDGTFQVEYTYGKDPYPPEG